MVFDTSAIVNEYPPQRVLRRWALAAASAIFFFGLSVPLHPIRWFLFSAWALLAFAATYVEHLGRITVTSNLLQVQRWGSVTQYARDRIVTISARSGGVQVALNDGRWVLVSWPFFVSKRERHARAGGLLKALGGVSDDDAG